MSSSARESAGPAARAGAERDVCGRGRNVTDARQLPGLVKAKLTNCPSSEPIDQRRPVFRGNFCKARDPLRIAPTPRTKLRSFYRSRLNRFSSDNRQAGDLALL
jgi:hypothetical protein